MPKNLKLNKPLLLKAVAWLKEHPTQCNMGNWFSSRNALDELPGGCGTAACLAGAICCVALANKPSVLSKQQDDGKLDTENRGRRLAGLTMGQANSLFFVANWPDKYTRMYQRGKDEERLSIIAAAVGARVRYFLRTGK